MICPKCGEEFEGVCLNCTNLDELIWLDNFIVITCPKCGSFKLEGKWRTLDFEDVIDYLISKNVRIHPELEIKEILISYNPFTITFKGEISKVDVEIVKQPKLKILKETCTRCSRESGGYYESILQLRADKRKLEKEEIEKVNKIINEILRAEKDNQKAFITKIVERKEGIDYYFGGRNIGKKVSRKIVNEFGAEIKESKTISGRVDGRDLYRFTYLVRLPSYKNGDVVKDDGKICIVTNAKIKKAVDIKTKQNVTLKNPKLLARKEEIKRGVVVESDEYVVELINLENNEVVFAEKNAEVKTGEEIFILELGNKFYIIPKELLNESR